MGICVSCRRRERKAPEKRSVPGTGGPAKGTAAAELLPRRVHRLPTMANSMSNIKMNNPIKIIVSKHRRRYMKDGFNLDLAYITDRLIAMGVPAEKLEGVYRNHIDEVYRFLEKMHKDHYKIYNLCSERSYDKSKFHERVERYAFEDHTPPKIEMIQPFCEDVHNWLGADSKNVAAVHCKAGKGRTGTMVCCYLLYSQQQETADAALKFYGTKRTLDDKGVTIPSQRRYVEYYAWLLRSGLQYAPTKIHIRELVMSPISFLHAGHSMPELVITQAHPFFKAPTGCHEVRRTDTAIHMHLTHCTPLCGDVRVDVINKGKILIGKGKERLFHFWFNTFFVAAGAGAVHHPPLPDSPNLETFKMTLNKWQLDDAHKDKHHKSYSEDFKMELIVQKLPDSSTFSAHPASSRAPSPPSSTASSCSEPDTEPDCNWDSGENPSSFPYIRLSDANLPEYAAVNDPTSAVNVNDTSAVTVSAHRRDCDALAFATARHYDDEPTLNPIYCGKDPSINPIYCGKDTVPNFCNKVDTVPKFCSKTDVANKPICCSKDITTNYCKIAIDPSFCKVNPNVVVSGNKTRGSSNYDNATSLDYSTSDEPMEYNDVFSSTPTSARESPVEECKTKRTDDKTKPRLSLGDMRASWREFSGKFASDSRRRKDES